MTGSDVLTLRVVGVVAGATRRMTVDMWRFVVLLKICCDILSMCDIVAVKKWKRRKKKLALNTCGETQCLNYDSHEFETKQNRLFTSHFFYNFFALKGKGRGKKAAVSYTWTFSLDKWVQVSFYRKVQYTFYVKVQVSDNLTWYQAHYHVYINVGTPKAQPRYLL